MFSNRGMVIYITISLYIGYEIYVYNKKYIFIVMNNYIDIKIDCYRFIYFFVFI